MYRQRSSMRLCLLILVSFLDSASGGSFDNSISYKLYQEGLRHQYIASDSQAAITAYQAADSQMTLWDRENIDFSGMYNDMGVIYSSIGEFDLARRAYEIILNSVPSHVNALSNLASLKASIGDIEGADALYSRGSQLPNVPVEFVHNHAIHLLNTGRHDASLLLFEEVVHARPSFYPSRNEIAKHLCTRDRMSESFNQFEVALADAAAAGDMNFFWQIYFQYVTSTPVLFPSEQFVESFRSFYLHNLYEALTIIPKDSIARPEVNMGCSYVGYYLIYQGYVDVIPRQLFSSLLMHVAGATIRPQGLTLPPLFQRDDVDTSATPPHPSASSPDHKISVGFLGSFCDYGAQDHSVTLLTKGVMQRLDRADFHILMISVSGNMPEEECRRTYDFLEVLVLPKFSLGPAKTIQFITDLSLNVMVFTEVGMSHELFFLAHSRLAARTVSFWGHAITSGIVDFDRVLDDGSPAAAAAGRGGGGRGGPDYFLSSVLFERCSPRCADAHVCRHDPGGSACDDEAQLKYSERLLLQEGLTTYFLRPPLPLPWWEIAGNLPQPLPASVDEVSPHRIQSLPDKLPFLANFLSGNDGGSYENSLAYLRRMLYTHNISELDIRLYCIPQTLYKLSPRNVDIVKRLLASDIGGVLVLLDGERTLSEQKQIIVNEFPSSSLDRIVFLRKLSQREYITLLAISDVVLDTFPVGGGRSSFAIFSTGTPIVMLYPETSILQLTFGMYRAMGIECSVCIAHDAESYISASIEIASNKTLQSTLRQEILRSNHRLYENSTVIEEWERMLKYIVSVPRPVPFAVVSANFSGDPTSALSRALTSSGTSSRRVNWVKDIHRIYASSNSDVPFREWVEKLPRAVSLALSHPYEQPPIRLMSVAAPHARVDSAPKEHVAVANNRSDYDTASYDREGISLGINLVEGKGKGKKELTPQEKLNVFNKTVLSLQLALGLNGCGFPSGTIKEVIVVDDGTVGLTNADKVLFSSAYPTFHFIFERSKSKTFTKKKKSWYKLKALSTIIKMAKYRYVLLIPSNAVAVAEPLLSPGLTRAARTFREEMEASAMPRAGTTCDTSRGSTSFSFLIRFALQLLNGYTDVSGSPTGRISGFSVRDEGSQRAPASAATGQRVFRQAAHVVLLNSITSSLLERDDTKAKDRSSDVIPEQCAAIAVDLDPHSLLGDGSHLLVQKCEKYSSTSAHPEGQVHINNKLSRGGSQFCACSVAHKTYLDTSTEFGRFVAEDVAAICEKIDGHLLKVDDVVQERFRDFTCLLALFSRERDVLSSTGSLNSEDARFLSRVDELYLQPSLWDADGVSFVVQGLEKEFVLDSRAATEPTMERRMGSRLTSRYRHAPPPPTNSPHEALLLNSTRPARRSSLKKVGRRSSADDLFHARAGVVFDKEDSFEFQDDNAKNEEKSICQYLNSTALHAHSVFPGAHAGAVFQWCSNGVYIDRGLSEASSSRRLALRLLSAGVRIAHLRDAMFDMIQE